MLMIVPLMIWSALTLIASHACSSEISMPTGEGRGERRSAAPG